MTDESAPSRPEAPSIFWFIPTQGDGFQLTTDRRSRPPDFGYYREIVTAVERLGYEGVLLPTGQICEDSWIVATGLATATERLKFLVALRPGVTSPAFAARQAAALDRISRGRLLLNLVVGGDAAELAGDGVFLPHDQRYGQAAEFLDVWRALMGGETVNHAGLHYRVEGGRLNFPSVQRPHPPLWFGGSSEAGQALAADQLDVYLTWGEPPQDVAAKFADVQARAAARGRSLRLGVRLHVIVRETEDLAWAAADRLIAGVSDAAIEAAQARFAAMDSVGQQRMSRLHGGRRDRLVVGPNLWAGVGLVRKGAGTALVGDPAQIAARIREYQSVGVETFILSGYPHLEEAYRVAELVFPELGLDRVRPATSDVIRGEFAT